MIQRRRDYDKREPSRDAHIIYIVCEGTGTEPAYFAFFEGLSSNLQVITIPPKDGTDPLKLMERAKQVLIGEERVYTVEYEHGDTVWFVIDTDTWEREGKILPLRNFCSEMNHGIPQKYDEVKAYSAWNVAQSNPCFEIWLYYHFYENRPEKELVDKFASFKEFVHKSISGGFDYEKDPVRIGDAIKNSETNIQRDVNGLLDIFSSELFLLAKEIEAFVKSEIQKLGNKLR
ncbi:MAG: RloB domain-containing protein [Paludibacteraceae bacterium]|nr:RloB domain-containing protein [Paludibacteraceae bacterium]